MFGQDLVIIGVGSSLTPADPISGLPRLASPGRSCPWGCERQWGKEIGETWTRDEGQLPVVLKIRPGILISGDYGAGCFYG